jgi:hypothetical protein
MAHQNFHDHANAQESCGKEVSSPVSPTKSSSGQYGPYRLMSRTTVTITISERTRCEAGPVNVRV